jgi:hypothetical protein
MSEIRQHLVIESKAAEIIDMVNIVVFKELASLYSIHLPR